MKLAIMQPYFFPYLGYFQLIRAVDIFVAFDDVSYIKRGWINRNFLLMGCAPIRFTVPLANASQFRPICGTLIASTAWQKKFLKTLHQAYAKAPYFSTVYVLAESVVTQHYPSLAELALSSLKAVMAYLGLETLVRPTSRTYGNGHLRGQDRILDICRQEKADVYLNLPGGRALYDPEMFAAANVDLRFLQSSNVSYPQFRCEFVPNLSMLDVLMFNNREAVRRLLKTCSAVH